MALDGGAGLVLAPLGVLDDLYVNMCPRGWAATDDEVEGVPGNWGDLPLERLWLSANHVDVNPEVEVTAHDHIVH